jgi:hypothetical protein
MSDFPHVLDRAEANKLARPDRPRDEPGRFASPNAASEVGREAEIHEAGFRTLLDHKDATEGPDPDERTYNSNNPADLERAHRDRQARQRGDDGGIEQVGDRLVTSAEAEELRRERFVKSHSANLPKPAPLADDIALTPDQAAERYSQTKQAQRAEAEGAATIAEAEQIAKDTGLHLWKEQGEPQHPVAEQRPLAVADHFARAEAALREGDDVAAYREILAARAITADTSAPPEIRAQYAYTEQVATEFKARNPAAAAAVEQPGINPHLAVALEQPEVRAELEARFAQVEQAQQAYVQGLQQNTQHVLAATLSHFPELEGVPAQSLPHVLKAMRRRCPIFLNWRAFRRSHFRMF